MRTSDLAAAVGVHPNTVRLYEVWGFLPPVPRDSNGYRRFGQNHLDCLRLARTLLQAPYPGGKEPALSAVRRLVAGDPAGALDAAERYLENVLIERQRAEQAVALVERWLSSRDGDTSFGTAAPLFASIETMLEESGPASASPGQSEPSNSESPGSAESGSVSRLSRSFEGSGHAGIRSAARAPADADAGPDLRIGEAAQLLGTTTDALRNWGRNGLYAVPRDAGNRYRLYTAALLDRLRVIRALGLAGYSQMAILRVLNRLDAGPFDGSEADPRTLLDTPLADEDARYATDRWLSTLAGQEERARDAIRLLREIAGRA